jgi:hypothetical protein
MKHILKNFASIQSSNNNPKHKFNEFERKTTMKLHQALFIAAVLASPSLANAAADFTVLRNSTPFTMNDPNPTKVINFNLPTTVNPSQATADSAVLDLEVKHSQFDFNEVYINPPTTVCTPDGATDANQAGSIGILQEHDDTNLKTEWATNHMTFSSNKLLPGANKLLICIRSVTGSAGPNVGNLDFIGVRNIVLHYHTTQ